LRTAPAAASVKPPAAVAPKRPQVAKAERAPGVAVKLPSPVGEKPVEAPARPQASAVPPKPAPAPAAKVAPLPSVRPAAVPPIAPASDAEQTLITSPQGPPRVRGLRLVGGGPPITVGPGTFVVGRAVGSDVRLDDRQVSRSHARLTVDEVSVWLEDLQTVNGTLVNGKEVKTRQLLRHGDIVQFGAAEFAVELITT